MPIRLKLRWSSRTWLDIGKVRIVKGRTLLIAQVSESGFIIDIRIECFALLAFEARREATGRR